MTGAQITRAFSGDLEIRADMSGRTIAGIVVPFGTTARVSDGGVPYEEQFQRGSFTKTIRERGDRVKLLYQHKSAEPIGRATLLREDAGGLYGEFAVSNVPAGDHAIELVRDGVLDSFSVGFAPVKHEDRGGVRVRTEVALREASLVTFPAYEDARIQAVRAMVGDDPVLAAVLDEFLSRVRGTEISVPTGDGQPAADAPSVVEPASATPDVSTIFRHLRRVAREKGIL